jgi:hypothetical protein
MRIHVRLLAARSARGLPERLSLQERGSRECRVRAAPAVSCAKCTRKCAHEHTGSAETLRHSLRNGFTAYAVLSPAKNSSCHRRCRLDGGYDPVGSYQPPAAWHQQRVSGPHGFAVRLAPFVVRAGCSLTRDSPRDTVSRRRCCVHRIPSRVRDDRDTPLLPGETGRFKSLICPTAKAEFCPSGYFAAATAPQDGMKARLRCAQPGRPPFPGLPADRDMPQRCQTRSD